MKCNQLTGHTLSVFGSDRALARGISQRLARLALVLVRAAASVLAADAVVHAGDALVAELHAAVGADPALDTVAHVISVVHATLANTVSAAVLAEAVVDCKRTTCVESLRHMKLTIYILYM